MRHSRKVWPDEDELVHLTREARGGRPGALDARPPRELGDPPPGPSGPPARAPARRARSDACHPVTRPPGDDPHVAEASPRAPPRGARVAPLTRCPRGRRDAPRAYPVSLITTRNLLASVWSSVWDTSLPSRVTRLG